MTTDALTALRTLTGNPQATFRDGQLEAINMLVDDKKRVLVVQRTGWGKSAVYFVSTHLLRQQGFGPTLIISPLLALMNNQIDAATNLGLRAYTINSANDLQVDQLSDLIANDEVDVLLVSPERLANPDFIENVMPLLGRGLIVIDEVHCISDWGHDFRPDYRRLGQVINRLPSGIPVLGTTATANDTVIQDVSVQLGDGLPIIRGPLRRSGLALSVLDLPDRAARLVWLDQNLRSFEGTGIIYCLTQRDVDQVAGYLESCGHKVGRYRSGGDITLDEKNESLGRLLRNEVKAVVASTALGMGYDKPDVSFVIHYQSTDSLVGYYQQVGRAGRALSSSLGVMMRGAEDKDIHAYFMKGTFPKKEAVDQILEAFKKADGPLSIQKIEAAVNLRKGVIESTLKQLSVEGIVNRVRAMTYERSLKNWEYPTDRVNQVFAAKQRDALLVNEYFATTDCRMRFIVNHLNDSDVSSCGICDNCTGKKITCSFTAEELAEAQKFLRRGYLPIEPRKQGWDRRNIPPHEQNAEGRCLSKWRDGGYGDLVVVGKQVDKYFSDELVDAVVAMISEWSLSDKPTWVTCVPSTKSGSLVPDVAGRIASKLGLPFVQAVSKVRNTASQKTMENSSHQGRNVAGAFSISGPLPAGPVFLIDDLVDSKWTLTEIGRILRQNGSGQVYPVALASTQSGDS
jgi:ATP-dependent DNA helicase RecQ